MKDFLGNELNVGDIVISTYQGSYSHDFIIGKIKKINPKTVSIMAFTDECIKKLKELSSERFKIWVEMNDEENVYNNWHSSSAKPSNKIILYKRFTNER